MARNKSDRPDVLSALHRDALVWDAHSCLPLRPDTDLGQLARHKDAGVDFVSINVGMDMNPVADVIGVLAAFRAGIQERSEDFALAGSVADIRRAKQDGRMAIAFDLEGSLPLQGEIAMVQFYYDLGVRQIHIAYNRNNSVGGGCHDTDIGLTDFGHEVVAEINRVGMLMDCSHTGHKTSLDIMAASTRPVVFSHANPKALVDHGRNISDQQIDACAATGGVIGVNGVSLFLGDPAASTESILRHIDYLVRRVGAAHVGLGIDYSYDAVTDDVPPDSHPAYWWPEDAGYDFDGARFARPEQFPEIIDGLFEMDYSETDILGILGENFARVAEATWR